MDFTFSTHIVPDDGVSDFLGTNVGFVVISQDATVTNSDFTLPGSLENGPDGLVLLILAETLSTQSPGRTWGPSIDDPGNLFTNDALSSYNQYLHGLPTPSTSRHQPSRHQTKL